MKKKYSITLVLVVILVIGVFMSSKKTYVNTLLENTSNLSETTWEIVQYSTPTQSASIRGTDWFIYFGKAGEGYLKLCETYPFTYKEESSTQMKLSFDSQNNDATTCQDTDGIQKFLLNVLAKPLVLEQKKTGDSMTTVLVISDGQNKLALVTRGREDTDGGSFSNTFLKKNQTVQIEPSLICPGDTPCGDIFDATLFPIVVTGVDDTGQSIADKKLLIQGSNALETVLPKGTYTVTPGIALQQTFHFEPLIFSITTIQEDSYTVPLSLVVGK